MKRLLYFVVMIALFSSCRKTTDDLLQNNNTTAEGPVNNGLEPALAYKWTSLPVPVEDADHNPIFDNLITPIGDDIYCSMGHSGRYYKLNKNTRRWELQGATNIYFSNFELGWQYLFSYQGKIYMGLLMSNNALTTRFVTFDLNGGGYTEMPAFPGTPVWEPTCFMIGSKGYIMGGVNDNDYPVNQLWEYDFITNVWTNKGPSPLGARTGMSAFVINNKVYAGLGYDIINLNNTPVKRYKDDWLSFDPGSAYAAVKANFPGAKRAYAKGFVLNGNPYVGFGYNINGSNSVYYKDFWKYNVSSNTWSEQDGWPGTVGTTYGHNICTFSVGNTGYLVKGAMNQFWHFSNSIFQ